jgi:hypothetical protein
MDDCPVHSPTLEQHLLDVAEVLEIFRRRQLYAESSRTGCRDTFGCFAAGVGAPNDSTQIAFFLKCCSDFRSEGT